MGGEHRSAPIPLSFAGAQWVSPRDGTAWVTEACAPWRCAVYVHVQVGELDLSVPAETAQRMLDDLSALLASARTGEEVTY